MTTPPPPPPGWYPDPDGTALVRWWDGRQWGNATKAAWVEGATAPPKKGPGCFGVGFAIAGALVLVALIVVSVASLISSGIDSSADTSGATRVTDATPAPTKAPTPTPRPSRDEQMRADGWSVIESGSLYGRWGDHANYTCGYWRCAYYEVASVDGCPRSLYVEANLVNDNGVAIGWTNGTLAGLRPEQSGAVLLEDYQETGGKFQISDVSCY